MPLSPFLKRLPKGMGRYDVFPFDAPGAFASLFGLVATAGMVDLLAGIRAAAIEGGFVAGIDLGSELLGFAEGLDGGVLGERYGE